MKGAEKNGIWSYIELSLHKTLNIVHLQNVGLLKEKNKGSRWDIQTKQDLMAACQGFGSTPEHAERLTFWMGCHMAAGQSGPGGVKQLTSWEGFHGCTSTKQVEARRRTTHMLEGISWVHVSESNEARRCTKTHSLKGIELAQVSESNGGQGERSNSHPGRDFISARQRNKRRPRGAQQLTHWKGFHGCTSANQMEARGAQQLTS